MSPEQQLKSIFLDIQNKNQNYSLRAFAKKLGTSPGALSEILKGKRTVSKKKLSDFVCRLNLSPIQSENLLQQYKKNSERAAQPAMILREDQFALIADWIHFAILNLIKSKKFVHRTDWIAEQIFISPRKVEEALQRLERLGLIQFNGKKYIRTVSDLKTPDDVISVSVMRSNLGDLEMVRQSLMEVHRDERDSTSTTMLINKNDLKKIKKYLRAVQDDFAEQFEVQDTTDVYRLSFHLFPLKKV